VTPADGPTVPWDDPDPGRPLPFWPALRDDMAHHLSPERRRSMSRWGRARAALAVAARSSGFRVAALYRLAHALRPRAGPAGRALSGLLSWAIRHAYGCSIAPGARLHGGLQLPHPQGLVIGDGAVVGPRAWIYQNVTIGGAPGKAGLPRVGSDARIYCGAVLTGPIRVGDYVQVGANAVVHRDVPDRTVVRAAPVQLTPLAPGPDEGPR
jgi:serine O-acetyltransferase